MKYQFTVDAIDPETSHGKVLGQIRKGASVLECGCASGYITKFMKEQLDCKVHIVEYEQKAFDVAKQYAEGGVCADLTKKGWSEAFAGMQFDYILFMDVLEHLTNPEATLQEAVALLKQDGVVLISLPNIAHNDILIDLHSNSFNYSDVGLLDDTHIHFYGRNNLDTLIRSAGLQMVKLDKTYVKTGRSELFWTKECRVSDGLLPVLLDRPDGEVYQFVITAYKEEYCKDHGIEEVEETKDATASHDKAIGILDVYQQYAQALKTLEERTSALVQAESTSHKLEIQLLECTQRYEACNAELQSIVEQKNTLEAQLANAEDRSKAISCQYENLQNRLQMSEMTLQKLGINYNQLELERNQIVASRGWRLLKKYYAIRDAIFPKDSVIREFLKKVAKKLFGLNANSAQQQFSNIDGQRGASRPTVDGFELIRQCKRIDILSVPHTAYVAKMLQSILLDAGIECYTHLSEPEIYEEIPYIMICPQNFKRFPAIYIAFQMEQTINSRWLTEEYMEILHNAYAVFDYSLENIEYFNNDPLLAPKLYYLPVDVCQGMMKDSYAAEKKEYDVLFYGAPFVEHRQRYLAPIGENFNLRIISEQFGPELYKEMNKAKILINIHYYENALLETTRLYETLSVSDCLIISERSGDPKEEAALEGIVDFVEVGDVDAMLERIRYWLSHEEERQARVAKNRTVLENRTSAAKFYLNRFLLANDRITFDDFYNSVNRYIQFNTDRICLSLPESTVRGAAFMKDNQYGFEFFPGLKHRMGWIGCGMSYKFMLRKAMDQEMEKILICEDDVYFPPDFQERFEHVLRYTEENEDWNVFSGIMADIGRVKALKYVEDKGEEYIYMDKMISMVFNLYDKSMFEMISSWDNMNRDVQKNTIDRYLEDKKLRILATCPFLVGHKEDLCSTIWGQQNTIYSDLIQKSSEKLRDLVEDFKRKS